MKPNHLILIFLILLGSKLMAQSEGPNQQSYVTMNFVSPFVGIAPRWKAGVYTPIAKNLFVGTELGFGSTFVSPEARVKVGRRYRVQHNYRSFELGPELIYMVHPKHFISAKYSHLTHSSKLRDGTILMQPDELYYDFTSLDYDRTVTSFHMFYGYMDTVSKRLGFIFKIGWGGRNKTVELTNITGRTLSANPRASGFASTNDGSGESYPIAFDLRIYYLFK